MMRFAWSLGIFIGLMSIFLLTRKAIRYFAQRIKTNHHLIQQIITTTNRISIWTLVVVAAYISLQNFSLPGQLNFFFRLIATVTLTLQVLILANDWIRYAISDHSLSVTSNPYLKTMKTSLTSIIIISVWVLGILFMLDNLGFNVATIVAGLGVGGIAVGLALQSVFKDLISSFTIIFDKPFEVGDFIIVGDLMGTVEQIGLNTTRVRSLSGELLIFPNSNLVESNIKNFKKMYERRIVFSFGVTYETDQSALEEIPSIVKSCITSQSKTRFDRAHFKEFGGSSLNFEAVYFVTEPDYNLYMDIQQQINFNLRKILKQKGVDFALPTQTIDFKLNQIQSFIKDSEFIGKIHASEHSTNMYKS